MDGLEYVALLIFFLGFSEQVISDVKLEIRWGDFKTLNGKILDFPAEAVLNLHFESLLFFPLILFLVLDVEVNIILVGFLDADGKIDGFFIQFNFLFNAQISKSLFKMQINHKFIPLSST